VSAPVASVSLLEQPKAVWAVAFACVIPFMGIGLVDPILPAISADLGATPAQTMLVFTSYLLVTGLAMFFTRSCPVGSAPSAPCCLGVARDRSPVAAVAVVAEA